MVTFEEWWKKEGLLYFGTGTEDDARNIWKAAQEVEREACLNLSGEPGCFTRTDLEDAIRARGEK